MKAILSFYLTTSLLPLLGATITFEGLPTGQPPAGMTASINQGKKPGRWVIQEQKDAPSAPKVLAQVDNENTNQRFPVCIVDDFKAKDVEVSVKFKPISGKTDRAAGLVWRYVDSENYYVVRANALENNVVLYKMEKGTRSDLKPIHADNKAYGKSAKVPSNQWSSLRVVAKGNRYSVFLNEQELFTVEDATFTAAGRVGMWTKADSTTAFDDFNFVEVH